MGDQPYPILTASALQKMPPHQSKCHAFTFNSWGYFVAACSLILAFATGPLHIPFAPLLFTSIAVLGLASANLAGLLVLGMPAYALVGVVLSNDLIQSGLYIKEQFRTGYESDASAALSCYAIAFLLLGHAAITYVTRRAWGRVAVSDSLRRWNWVALVLVGLAAAALLGGVVAAFGGANAVGGDRFIYWNTLPDAISKAIALTRAYALPVLAVLAGFYLMAFRRNYLSTLTLLVLPHIALYLMGEKMSAFTATVTAFLFGMGVAAIASGKVLRLTMRMVASLAIVASAVALLTVIGFERTASSDATEALLDRLVLQGHVWFGTFELASHGPFLSLIELAAPDSIDRPSGLNLLSYAISDPTYVYTRAGYGLTFTMGGPPAALAAFGILGGFVVYTLTSMTYAAVVAALLYFLSRRAYASAAVLLFAVPLITSTVLMGFLDNMYNPVSLVVVGTTITTLMFLIARRGRTVDSDAAGHSSARSARRPRRARKWLSPESTRPSGS